MITVGIIGYGYWGPNIVRNFSKLPGVKVGAICDFNPIAIEYAQKEYPHLPIVSDYNEIVSSKEIDVVAIITPVSTHYELAKKALQNGKHVFVEKPMAPTSDQVEKLIEIAEKKKLLIMVDHTFLFTSAVRKIKDLIDEDVLGNLYYFDSTRVNLGPFRHDTNVIWDLASHDLSIMDYVIKEKPIAITASGRSLFGNGLEDVGYMTVYFSNNMIAHFNVNWLSPIKVRTTLVGGERKMLVWNDLDTDEKLKIHDKHLIFENREGIDNLLSSYRSGDMWVPKLEQCEALRIETEYLIDCITTGKTPVNDGCSALRVIKILEASNESLRNKGQMVLL
ncbi:MAG: Gfo/Idh/MocA family oxidoreductase [Candidatus Tectomicrobia bacterium]|nr:Gfo/Idh/MocA family oxidoreductase [Candidatus Tectomicrobia bacterium]